MLIKHTSKQYDISLFKPYSRRFKTLIVECYKYTLIIDLR